MMENSAVIREKGLRKQEERNHNGSFFFGKLNSTEQ
jgi:hypothetical protein